MAEKNPAPSAVDHAANIEAMLLDHERRIGVLEGKGASVAPAAIPHAAPGLGFKVHESKPEKS